MLRAGDPTRICICTRFDDEEYHGDYYGVEADPNTRLSFLTANLWMDYLIRHGHTRTIPVEDMDSPLTVPERGWDFYRVYLRDDATNTPLDLSKTLAELGLTERRVWVRFERAE